MNSKDRILNALSFKSVDIPGLRIDVSPRGLYEHGEKLRDLLKTVVGDFGPISDMPIPVPDAKAVDEHGEYLEYITDEWGVEWQYRIFKMAGHPHKRPLDDWNAFANYIPPKNPYPAKGTAAFEALKNNLDINFKDYFKLSGWNTIFEIMIAVRKFEDVLADLYEDNAEINQLADMICERRRQEVNSLIELDVDAVQFADDFGTQNNMLISPQIYRHFFKPRMKNLIKPVKLTNKKAFMHCCGYAFPIIEDFKEIGIDAIWPQLSVYPQKELAEFCRSIDMAIEIHPERSNLMTFGTPDDVKREMYHYIETFRPQDGGSWFYIEIDNGFPFENIEALVEVLAQLRKK